MKKLLTFLCAALLLCAPASTLAAPKKQEYNMSNITCDEIFSDEEVATYMLFWLDGYLSHKQNNMMFSERSMKEIAEALLQECEDAPRRKLGSILKSWK